MWLVPNVVSPVLFAVLVALMILSQILGTPAWLALVSTLAPAARRGRVMGAVATAEGVGAVLGPLIAGWLWDIQHSYIFFGSATFLSLAALLALFTLRDGRESATA